MSELETKASRIEIQGPDGLAIRQLVPDDDQAYFDALHHDPARFQHGEEKTLKKYQTVENVRASIEDPDEKRLRFGVWDGNTMTGTVNLQFNRPRSAELDIGSATAATTIPKGAQAC